MTEKLENVLKLIRKKYKNLWDGAKARLRNL